MEISKAGWGLGSGEQVLGSWSVLDILQVPELVHWPGSRGLGSIITDGHFDCIHAFLDVAVMVVTLHLFRFPFLASFLYEGNVDKKTGEVTFDPQYKATKGHYRLSLVLCCCSARWTWSPRTSLSGLRTDKEACHSLLCPAFLQGFVYRLRGPPLGGPCKDVNYVSICRETLVKENTQLRCDANPRFSLLPT